MTVSQQPCPPVEMDGDASPRPRSVRLAAAALLGAAVLAGPAAAKDAGTPISISVQQPDTLAPYGGDNATARSTKATYNEALAFVRGMPSGEYRTEGSAYQVYNDGGRKIVRSSDARSTSIHTLDEDGSLLMYKQQVGSWRSDFKTTHFSRDNGALLEMRQDSATRWDLAPPLNSQQTHITRVYASGASATWTDGSGTWHNEAPRGTPWLER